MARVTSFAVAAAAAHVATVTGRCRRTLSHLLVVAAAGVAVAAAVLAADNRGWSTLVDWDEDSAAATTLHRELGRCW